MIWLSVTNMQKEKRKGSNIFYSTVGCTGWQKYNSPLNIQMCSLHNKGLCPVWKVQSAAVSDDQPLWKVAKRFFHPCLWLPEWREGDAQQALPFSRVLGILRKGLYNGGCDGRGCGRLVHCLSSRHKACRCVMGAGEEPSVFLLHWQWSGYHGACWHSQTVFKPLYCSVEPSGCSYIAMCPISPNCFQHYYTENMYDI